MKTIVKPLMTWLLLFLGLSLNAQQRLAVRSLKIGDTVPDLVLSKILVSGKLQNQHLSDYKAKLLILDFWDTFCASCIENFPRLDAIQKLYAGKMQLLTVTYQKEEVIRKFKGTNSIAKVMNLPIMIEDELLKSYFPHRFVSHTVWINKGVVIAISNPEYIDPKVIDRVLAGQQINLPVKDDFGTYDAKASSLLNESTLKDKKIYSVISGYRNGISNNGSQISTTMDSVNGTVKNMYLNMQSIVRLYLLLLRKIDPWDYVLKPDMIFVEAADSTHYDLNYKPKDEFQEDWVRKNSISYESVLPATLNERECAKVMLADLDNKLGLYGRMEMRPHKVWVIKAAASPAVHEKGMVKEKLSQFLTELKVNMMMLPDLSAGAPLFASPGLNMGQLVSMSQYSDRSGLESVLMQNGLELVEEVRPIKVFVLTEIKR